MHRPTRLRPLTLTLALGALVALFGAGAAHATDPEACSAEPADEVPSNRVALFDVYWNNSDDRNDPNSKTLVNNPCPPTVSHTAGGTDPITGLPTPPTTTRTASDIHIDHTIIHIPESAKRTVTNSNSEDYGGGFYNFLRRGPDEENGDASYAPSAEVYIVPACEKTATNPSLCLGASAGLLTPGDWAPDPANRNEGTKIQYEFEAIREPGHATQGWGNVFVFKIEEDPEIQAQRPRIIWRTDDADDNEWKVAPGAYDYAYWAFTEPGTYVFHVHAKGHPNKQRTGGPLTTADTVTSEVRRYTFQVGNLPVNHEPLFNVTRKVTENAPAGTNVGEPILVKDLDADTLCFALDGLGAHENFTINGAANAEKCGTLTAVNRSGNGQMRAQIQVKAGADLDYESIDFYDIKLLVSDGQDHEGNVDLSTIDDSVIVSISLRDDTSDNPEGPSRNPFSVTAEYPSPSAGEAGFDLVATWNGPAAGATFRWYRLPHGDEGFQAGTDKRITVRPGHTGAWEYWARVTYRNGGVTRTRESNRVRVVWPWPSSE